MESMSYRCRLHPPPLRLVFHKTVDGMQSHAFQLLCNETGYFLQTYVAFPFFGRKSSVLQWYRSAMRHTMSNGGTEVPASYNWSVRSTSGRASLAVTWVYPAFSRACWNGFSGCPPFFLSSVHFEFLLSFFREKFPFSYLN